MTFILAGQGTGTAPYRAKMKVRRRQAKEWRRSHRSEVQRALRLRQKKTRQRR